MARIQILELPEGAADERPPFALVIDQARVEDFYPDVEDKSVWQAFQERVATEDPLQRIAEQVGARTVLVFEDTIDIPANQPSPTPNRDQGIPPGSTYQMTVDGVPLVWEPAQPGGQQESTGRPTHPDGTPYNYSEITAEGWEHCDGCRTWGQWTAEDPHDCPSTFVKGPAADG